MSRKSMQVMVLKLNNYNAQQKNRRGISIGKVA